MFFLSVNLEHTGFILNKIIITIVAVFLPFLQWASEGSDWSALAKEDLKASKELIEKHHPALVDPLADHVDFKKWLSDGYEGALELADKVSSFEGYRDVLAFYAAGFRDGHLSVVTQGTHSSWPQFILTYNHGKFLIVSDLPGTDPQKLPPHGAEVIALNGEDPCVLIERNLFPYMVDDPALESSWSRLTLPLVLNTGNPFIEPIKNITYRFEGQEFSYALKWTNLSQEEVIYYRMLALYGQPLDFSIREFGDNGVWISLPTFYEPTEGVYEALNAIVAQLPDLRDRHPIVFDLRFNTGGMSTWVVKILTALYGKEYLGSISIKNSTSYADDRPSEGMIHYIESILSGMEASGIPVDDETYVICKEYCKNMKKALSNGDIFLSRPIGLSPFADMKHDRVVSNPVAGTVYFLTDEYCFSSALLFADAILSIPNVVHIGATTDADTIFGQALKVPLPGKKSEILIPTMVRRNWKRGNNEPYRPQHVFPKQMRDQKELEEWVLKLKKS